LPLINRPAGQDSSLQREVESLNRSGFIVPTEGQLRFVVLSGVLSRE
jgi:hypothetical protein